MRVRIGRLIFTRARVVSDVVSDHFNGFGICYQLNVCVSSPYLNPTVEIRFIIAAVRHTLDKRKSRKIKILREIIDSFTITKGTNLYPVLRSR